MPTILVNKNDLESLVGKNFSIEQLESYLPWVKGELKGIDEKSGDVKIELNDSNRPDLWCTEGIARQIRLKLKGKSQKYPFYANGTKNRILRIVVEKGVQAVRPYIAACAISNFVMSKEALGQFIQTQEKLADVFGQKRKLLSISIYHLEEVKFPLTYKAVSSEEIRFVPLGFEEKLSLKEILEQHPKGKTYRNVFNDNEESLPLIVDQKGTVLSFPPIINGREAGEVKTGDRDLMVEVTGTDLRLVNLVLNILATNLYDRGAVIVPISVRYPFKTLFGKEVIFPREIDASLIVQAEEIERVLGESFKQDKVKKALLSYGHKVGIASDSQFKVTPPPYRDDLLHSVDVIEDVAISMGYHSFVPELPKDFSRGALSKQEEFSDTLREYFVGFGFQEMISNILTSREELVEKMKLEDTDPMLVEIENVMTSQFSIIRNQILPSLLRVEAASGKAFYPHHIFEIGEVAEKDLAQNLGSRTKIQLSALIAHPNASFSEIHSFLDMLFYYLTGTKILVHSLRAMDHPSFIPGRFGEILYKDETMPEKETMVGTLGEIHPEVLDRWQIGVPCAALTLDVDGLLDLSKD